MFPFRRFEVEGHSMQPLFNPGDKIVINCWAYLFSNPRPKDIVAFQLRDNSTKLLLKRVEKVSDGKISVSGINQGDSLDSKQLGTIKKKDLIGKVWIKY